MTEAGLCCLHFSVITKEYEQCPSLVEKSIVRV